MASKGKQLCPYEYSLLAHFIQLKYQFAGFDYEKGIQIQDWNRANPF